MSITNYLKLAPVSDIVKFHAEEKDFEKKAIAFCGVPRKHPYDSKKIIVVIEPLSSQALFYEFRLDDILHIDDLPSISLEKGQNLRMVKVWVSKGSYGIRYESFKVENLNNLKRGLDN